jgi:hypothetical protein
MAALPNSAEMRAMGVVLGRSCERKCQSGDYAEGVVPGVGKNQSPDVPMPLVETNQTQAECKHLNANVQIAVHQSEKKGRCKVGNYCIHPLLQKSIGEGSKKCFLCDWSAN